MEMKEFNAKAVARIVSDLIKYGFMDGSFFEIDNEEVLYECYLAMKNEPEFHGIHTKYNIYYEEEVKILN